MHLILTATRDLRSYVASLSIVKAFAFRYRSSWAVLKGTWDSDEEFEAGAITLCIAGTLAGFSLTVYLIAFYFEAPDCLLAVFWSLFFLGVFIVGLVLAHRVSQ
ncbi:hypothetical protein BWI93_27310 [Siphonobacter sp. BAB-5385]|uniref:hypothetical protein n=1 Tax=Siphonobacter sp. BAB-5385 TaxID=1864822 RepID=UPI000B9DD46B|nr:hypothetical protein [Siphonobacter sp. BAB-5385]OZI05098.1 hypothetical protein BWI93_27310 [Siphonobacter sp. BAB-5385]